MNWSKFIPGRSYPIVEGQGNPVWLLGTLAADPIALGSGEWDVLQFTSQDEANQAFDQLVIDGMGTAAGYVIVTVDGDAVRFGRYKGFRSVLRDVPGGEVEGWGLERLAEKARAIANPGVRMEDRGFVRQQAKPIPFDRDKVPGFGSKADLEHELEYAESLRTGAEQTIQPAPTKPCRRILPGEKGYDRATDAALLRKALYECGNDKSAADAQVAAFLETGRMTDGKPIGWTLEKRMDEISRQGL